jgi:acetyl esterase/lipase
MTYAIDPELAPFVASIPSGSFVDPVPARRFFEDVNAMLSAGIDTSALVIEDGSVPGEAGRPPVPVRIYRPKDAPDISAAILQIHGGGSPQDYADKFVRYRGVRVKELGPAQ